MGRRVDSIAHEKSPKHKLGALKVAATCLFLSRKARTIISMLALNPQTGESSGASLGVPSEALLHQHNAAVHIGSLGTTLQRGENRHFKSPPCHKTRRASKWRLPTLPRCNAVPSAMLSLTTLFGMGRGGTSAL